MTSAKGVVMEGNKPVIEIKFTLSVHKLLAELLHLHVILSDQSVMCCSHITFLYQLICGRERWKQRKCGLIQAVLWELKVIHILNAETYWGKKVYFCS